jgi:two-component system, NtrC family, sensor kinase
MTIKEIVTMTAELNFCVGAEILLKDLLDDKDVTPLLDVLRRAGIKSAALCDGKGAILFARGEEGFDRLALLNMADRKDFFRPPGNGLRTSPLFHEGEPVGFLILSGLDEIDSDKASLALDAAIISLNALVRNSAKRLLTTELHTKVVNRSYEDLLEINRQLTLSETKYKDLAQTLEKKVEERSADLKKAQAKLIQQEKMASIGQLAAGVAHEINNPIGFIMSNLSTLSKYTGNLKDMLRFYEDEYKRLSPEDQHERALRARLKIDFILGDLQALVEQSLSGAQRVGRIVADLKGFSHLDDSPEKDLDINSEIDSVLSVLSHWIKAKEGSVRKEYGNLNTIQGNPALLSQVFFNILLNALQSRETGPTIRISTRQDSGKIVISVADNGKGIPPDVINRVFEPFFTTRDVGQGMGMGLAVAYDIVLAHEGTIDIESEEEKGTIVTVVLPLTGAADVKVR